MTGLVIGFCECHVAFVKVLTQGRFISMYDKIHYKFKKKKKGEKKKRNVESIVPY